MIRRGVLAGLLAAALAACAPRIQDPGPLANHQAALTESAFVTEDGVELPLRVWRPEGPPKAVIVALHGFNDYSNAFDAPGRYWAERGIQTYAYDQRGFGASPQRGIWPGSERLTGDLRALSRVLRARHPGLPLILLGTSMGGGVVMSAAAANPHRPEFDGLVLVAPAVWGRETMPWLYASSLWLATRTVPWLPVSGQSLGIQASDNIEMLRAMGRDPMVLKESRVDAIGGVVDLMDKAYSAAPKLTGRAFFLYGEHDEVIPKGPTFSMLGRLPEDAGSRQTKALYETGWHMLLRDLEARIVLDDIAFWIEHPDRPLPSGADRRMAEELRRRAEKQGAGAGTPSS
jgi:alpha-beta hydrolase superfamily lysophospholipase